MSTKQERLDHIAKLKQVSQDAYTRYDRAFRHIGANEAECSERYHAWQKAYKEWQDAEFAEEMRMYEFAVLLGTAGFMKRPVRRTF